MRTELGLLIFPKGEAIELSGVCGIILTPHRETGLRTCMEVVMDTPWSMRLEFESEAEASAHCAKAVQLWLENRQRRMHSVDVWAHAARDLYDNLKAHHTHSQQECKVVFVGDEQKLEVDLGESYSEASLYSDTCLALHGYEELSKKHE